MLHLSFTAVCDVTPLAGMAELEGCFLTGSLVDDVTPLAGLARLERLDLGDTQISDAGPLAGLHNLRSLDLSGTRISDNAPVADLVPLTALANLRWLVLRGAQAEVSDVFRHGNCQIITGAIVSRRRR